MARRVWDASAPGCTLARPEGLPGRVAAPWTTRPRHDSLLITVQLHFFSPGSQVRLTSPRARPGAKDEMWDLVVVIPLVGHRRCSVDMDASLQVGTGSH